MHRLLLTLCAILLTMAGQAQGYILTQNLPAYTSYAVVKISGTSLYESASTTSAKLMKWTSNSDDYTATAYYFKTSDRPESEGTTAVATFPAQTAFPIVDQTDYFYVVEIVLSDFATHYTYAYLPINEATKYDATAVKSPVAVTYNRETNTCSTPQLYRRTDCYSDLPFGLSLDADTYSDEGFTATISIPFIGTSTTTFVASSPVTVRFVDGETNVLIEDQIDENEDDGSLTEYQQLTVEMPATAQSNCLAALSRALLGTSIDTYSSIIDNVLSRRYEALFARLNNGKYIHVDYIDYAYNAPLWIRNGSDECGSGSTTVERTVNINAEGPGTYSYSKRKNFVQVVANQHCHVKQFVSNNQDETQELYSNAIQSSAEQGTAFVYYLNPEITKYDINILFAHDSLTTITCGEHGVVNRCSKSGQYRGNHSARAHWTINQQQSKSFYNPIKQGSTFKNQPWYLRILSQKGYILDAVTVNGHDVSSQTSVLKSAASDNDNEVRLLALSAIPFQVGSDNVPHKKVVVTFKKIKEEEPEKENPPKQDIDSGTDPGTRKGPGTETTPGTSSGNNSNGGYIGSEYEGKGVDRISFNLKGNVKSVECFSPKDPKERRVCVWDGPMDYNYLLFDEKGNLVYVNASYKSDKIYDHSWKKNIERNEKGQIVAAKPWWRFTYNEQGQIATISSYRPANHEKPEICEYDSNRNLISLKTDPKKYTGFIFVIEKVDDHGNWTSRSYYTRGFDDILIERVIRTITYW